VTGSHALASHLCLDSYRPIPFQLRFRISHLILARDGPSLRRGRCGAIPAIPYLLTPVPQITPPTTYPNLASVATKYLNGYYTNLSKITIAPGARSESYRHPPYSLTTVRRLIATYRTMAHSLSYRYEFGSSPSLTGAGSYYVRTVVLALHWQTLPNFNVG
jgi:hypothetical protein